MQFALLSVKSRADHIHSPDHKSSHIHEPERKDQEHIMLPSSNQICLSLIMEQFPVKQFGEFAKSVTQSFNLCHIYIYIYMSVSRNNASFLEDEYYDTRVEITLTVNKQDGYSVRNVGNISQLKRHCGRNAVSTTFTYFQINWYRALLNKESIYTCNRNRALYTSADDVWEKPIEYLFRRKSTKIHKEFTKNSICSASDGLWNLFLQTRVSCPYKQAQDQTHHRFTVFHQMNANDSQKSSKAQLETQRGQRFSRSY